MKREVSVREVMEVRRAIKRLPLSSEDNSEVMAVITKTHRNGFMSRADFNYLKSVVSKYNGDAT